MVIPRNSETFQRAFGALGFKLVRKTLVHLRIGRLLEKQIFAGATSVACLQQTFFEDPLWQWQILPKTLPRLLIRPTIIGPCSVGAFLGMFVAYVPSITIPAPEQHLPAPFFGIFGSVALYGCSMVFRSYFRSLDVLKEQLRSMSFENARSHCCDSNHRYWDFYCLLLLFFTFLC